jgi:hypothetical protein
MLFIYSRYKSFLREMDLLSGQLATALRKEPRTSQIQCRSAVHSTVKLNETHQQCMFYGNGTLRNVTVLVNIKLHCFSILGHATRTVTPEYREVSCKNSCERHKWTNPSESYNDH